MKRYDKIAAPVFVEVTAHKKWLLIKTHIVPGWRVGDFLYLILCKHKNLHVANKKVCNYFANINICSIFALSNKTNRSNIKIKDYETERYKESG